MTISIATITHVASAVPSNSSTTKTTTLTLPSSITSGNDVLVFAASRGHTSSTPTMSCIDNDTDGNGFALVSTNNNRRGHFWWKRATLNTAGSKVTIDGAVDSLAAGCSVYSGCSQGPNPMTVLALKTLAASGGAAVISIATLGSVGDTNARSTYTCSVTAAPSANNLVLVGVLNTMAAGTVVTPSSVSGCGMVFSLVTSGISFGGAQGSETHFISLWRSMSATPSSSVVSVNLPTNGTGCAILVHQVSGVSTSGTSGANALGKSATSDDAQGSASAVSANGGSATSTANAWFTIDCPVAQARDNPGNGYTVLQNAAYATPSVNLASAYNLDDTAGQSVWTGNSQRRAAIVVELVADNPGGSSSKTMQAFTPSFASSMVGLVVFNYSSDENVSGQTCFNPGSLTSRFQQLNTGGGDSAVFHGSALQLGGPVSTGTFTWNQTDVDAVSLAFDLRPQETSTSTASSSPLIQNPIHTYGGAGTYVVTLTVTDALGRSSSTTGSVTVA